MKKRLVKIRTAPIANSVIFLLLGITIVSNTEGILKMISYIIGSLFIAYGVEKLYQYSKEKTKSNSLKYGISIILIGLIIILCGPLIEDIIRIPIGLFMTYIGLIKLDFSLKLKSSNPNFWLYSAMISILIIVGGIYIIINQNILFVTMGIYLIIYSILNILENLFYTNKVVR